MQGANMLKRRSMDEGAGPRSCGSKRMCLEAELQVAEYPMEISHFVPATSQQQEEQVGAVRPRPSQLHCLRCLGGEPGHINHIMGN